MIQNVLNGNPEDEITSDTSQSQSTDSGVGKDGQIKDQENTNQQGMTTSQNPKNEKPKDFKQ